MDQKKRSRMDTAIAGCANIHPTNACRRTRCARSGLCVADASRRASKAKHAVRTDGFDSVINPASAVNYEFQFWGLRVCVS